MSVTGEPALRRDLALAIVDETQAQAPTTLAFLIASAFAARTVDAQAGHGFLQLATWADATARRYGTFPAIATLLRNACPVVLRELERHDAADASFASDLDALDNLIAGSLATVDAAASATHTGDHIDETIAAFLVKLDDADPLTAEHSRAVSLWCRRLGRRLALPDEQTTFVARGGLLHDVGKTLTPREILLAPRGLTDDEYAIIQDHATHGAAMVDEVEQLKPFVPLVGGHHERLDGRGYPDRRTASEISLDVRIVTVADCFNAMIGRRPYRAPLTPAAALEQLVKHRGTQFDPLVVEAMIDVIEHPE